MKRKKITISRKLVFILLYLVILPIAVISTLFLVTYQTNKPALFTLTNDEGESYVPKVIKPEKIEAFTFDFYCLEYNEPILNSKDEITTKTTMKFKAATYGKKGSITVTDISYQVVFASNWIGYQSNKSSTITLTMGANKNTATYKTTSISNYDLLYPKRKLLFINKKAPDAYVLLKWKEKDNTTGKETSQNFIVEYSYGQYFITGLSKGGIGANN